MISSQEKTLAEPMLSMHLPSPPSPVSRQEELTLRPFSGTGQLFHRHPAIHHDLFSAEDYEETPPSTPMLQDHSSPIADLPSPPSNHYNFMTWTQNSISTPSTPSKRRKQLHPMRSPSSSRIVDVTNLNMRPLALEEGKTEPSEVDSSLQMNRSPSHASSAHSIMSEDSFMSKAALKSKQSIVLDVFSVYMKNPKSLLQKSRPSFKPAKKKARASSRASHSSHHHRPSSLVFTEQALSRDMIRDPSEDNKEKTQTLFRGQKTLPEEIEASKEIDLSRFKETKGAPTVQWKGSPIDVPKDSEGYDDCTKEEIQTCRILRIMPAQYLHIKQVMLQQILKHHYKKREAQAWFRIDVNKTNRLYDWFSALGWIPSREDWEEQIPKIFGL